MQDCRIAGLRKYGKLCRSWSEVGVFPEGDVEMVAEVVHVELWSVGENEGFGRWKLRILAREKEAVREDLAYGSEAGVRLELDYG